MVRRSAHPPACTCVDCTKRRLDRLSISAEDGRTPARSIQRPKPTQAAQSIRSKATRQIVGGAVFALVFVSMVGGALVLLLGSGGIGSVVETARGTPRETASTPPPPSTPPLNIPDLPTSTDNLEMSPHPTGSTFARMEAEIVRLTNIKRREHGLSPLRYDHHLSRVARAHSRNMKKQRKGESHVLGGKDPTDRVRGSAYTCPSGFVPFGAGENIAQGYFGAKDVVNGWMNSPGHKANILDPRARGIGVGVVGNVFTRWLGMGGTYFTQNFVSC